MIRIHRFLPVLVALLCCTVAATTAANERVSAATGQVRAAEQAFADAFEARDLERFAAFIHADAVFAGRDGPLQGRDAVLAVWSRFFESATAPFRWAPERVLVNAAGNLGSTTGPVWDAAGRHVGAFASTWQRQADGSWQVIFDTSPSCPPPGEC